MLMNESEHDCRSHFHPTPEQVSELIARAKEHELGIEFLRNGSQDAVAAVFAVHAFTVDAARKELAEGGAE